MTEHKTCDNQYEDNGHMTEQEHLLAIQYLQIMATVAET